VGIMANIIVPKESNPARIDNFLGINEDVDGKLGLNLGEAINMLNFKTTQKFKLKQREGYAEILHFAAGKINGMIMYKGKLMVAHGGNLFEFEGSEL
jgi:hypothetical protein